ncbi:MAG: cupin domain-containing protein [Mariprofundus sp.]|nr:cupin domain-containing protein [Mariprofundus sp.]
MLKSAEKWIADLGLQQHPEGGWYREVYRSSETIAVEGLAKRFDGERCCCTSIYFLLQGSEFSAFHRIKQDELWHFYQGDGLSVHVIDKRGNYSQKRLGSGLNDGEAFMQVVEAGDWFGATVAPGSYALVGCTVAPGFDFADFEMAEFQALVASYPQHKVIIEQLTRRLSENENLTA